MSITPDYPAALSVETGVPGLGAIIFAVCAAALAGLLFGYDTGVASGIQGYLQSYFHLSNTQLGFAIASLELGCVPGSLFSGSLADRFGRKKMLIVCAVLFAVSGVLSAIPRSFTELVLARIIGGLAIGASSMIAPVYIAEIAPERHRGRLGSLFQLGIVIGIAGVYWVNYAIVSAGSHVPIGPANAMTWNQTVGWRWMLGSETLPAIIFLLMILAAPESPRWLVINNREEAGRDILKRFIGTVGADREIKAVKETAAQEEGKFSELFTARYRLPLVIGLFLAIFQQFSGINSIIYYAPRVFEAAGVTAGHAFGFTAIMGTAKLPAVFIAFSLVDKAGRKILLAIGTAVQVLALVSVAAIFHLADRIVTPTLVKGKMMPVSTIHFNHSQVWILLGCILIFCVAFTMAMGPLVWIIISEIFPARIRGRAASVCVVALWLATFVVAQSFPMLKSDVGMSATYLIYAGCSLITFLFVVVVLPETKGRTLEQIESYWRNRREKQPFRNSGKT